MVYDFQVQKLNEVYFRITSEDESLLLNLYNYLKVDVENARYSPKMRLKMWDGKVSFFNLKFNTLPIGLFPQFRDFCKKYSYTYSLNFDTSSFKNQISDEELEAFYKKLFEGTKFYPRDYQKDFIKLSLNNKRGVLVLGTGGGKSICLYTIIRYLLQFNKKIVLIVPTITLVNQMESDFKEYGFKEIEHYVTKMYNGEYPDLKKEVLISTYQSLAKQPPEFFQQYNVILNDETHDAKSKSIKYIMENSINAEYRIGDTGTLPKDNLCDFYNVTGYIGPVMYEKSSSSLQEEGYLAKANVRCLVVKYPTSIINSNKNISFNEEEKLVYENLDRNKVLDFIYSKIYKDQNSLILVEEIKHLNLVKQHLLLSEQFLNEERQLYVISGKVSPKQREYVRKLTETNNNVTILATYGTMAVGVNIKNLHHLILLSSSKSVVRVVQSIGRILRLMEGKTKAWLWDVVDDLRYTTRYGNEKLNYLYQHFSGVDDGYRKFKGRLDFYKEQKFDYKILEKKLEDL